MAGQNDYETIESRLEPPPMIPRAPGNASAELATGGLPHTPALTSKDDVDLESGRNPADATASSAGSAEHISSKRSDTAMIKESKKGGSSESEAEKPAEKPKKEVKNNNGVGTFCCIFSAVTIFLAVICLLGLGAMFLYNTDDFVPSRNSTGNTTDTTTTMSPIALKLEQLSVGTTSAQNTSQTGKTVTPTTPSSLTTTTSKVFVSTSTSTSRPTPSSEVTTSSQGTTSSEGTTPSERTSSTEGTTTKDGPTSTDGTTTTEGTTSADETTTVLTTTDSVTTESSVATSASTTASTRVSTTAEATTADIAVTDTTTDLISSTTNDGPIN